MLYICTGNIARTKYIIIMDKQLYGLYLSQKYVDDDSDPSVFHRPYGLDSSSCGICICASYDKEKLDHYCDVLQEADNIRFSLRNSNTIREFYSVNKIDLV